MGRHGDLPVEEDLDAHGRRLHHRRHWPGVVLYLTTTVLAGGTGWMFGHGPDVSRAEPLVWHVTATPSPTPAPTVTVTETVARTLTRWRVRTAAPPPPRMVTVTRWRTPAPAPTVTRWRTRTVAPPPPEGEQPNDSVHSGFGG